MGTKKGDQNKLGSCEEEGIRHFLLARCVRTSLRILDPSTVISLQENCSTDGATRLVEVPR